MNKKITNILAIFVLLLLTGQSYAFTTPNMGLLDLGTLFNINEGDYIVTNFLPYFGYSTGMDTYGEQSMSAPIRAVMIPFLLAMMSVAFILLGYNAVVGTLNTANEGKFLGGKWSSVFTPVRTAVGFAFLLPIVSGFSIVQNVLVFFGAQNIWVSDVMLARYIDSQNDNLVGQVLVNKNTRLQFLENIQAGVIHKACQNYFALITDDASQSKRASKGAFVSNNYKQLKVNNSKFQRANAYGDEIQRFDLGFVSSTYNSATSSGQNLNSRDQLADACGQLAISTEGGAPKNSSWEFHNDTNPNKVMNDGEKESAFFTGSVSMIDDETYQKYQKAQLMVAKAKVIEDSGASAAIAKKILTAVHSGRVGNSSETYQAFIEDVAEMLHKESYSYLDLVRRRIDTSLMKDILGKEKLKRAGVAGAGAWFFLINLQSDQLSSVINTPAKIECYYGNGEHGKCSSELSQLVKVDQLKGYSSDIVADLNTVNKILTDALVYLKSNFVDYSGYEINNTFAPISTAGYQFSPNTQLAKFLPKDANGNQVDLNKFFTGAYNNPISGNDFNIVGSENPLIFTHTFGMKLMQWGVSLMENSDGANTAMVLPIFFTILTISVMLAYYVPLMPFIVWVSAIIGWIGLLAEAMVGVVLWAVAHIIPDKDSFVGRQGQGYMLMLSIFTRLPMLVIGFAFANALLVPTGRYVNEFFGFAAKSLLSGSGLMWTISIISMTIIFAFIMVSLVKNVISLMYNISDKSLMWIGGPSTGAMREMVQGIEGQAQGGVQQGMGSVSGAGNSLGMILRSQTATGSIQPGTKGGSPNPMPTPNPTIGTGGPSPTPTPNPTPNPTIGTGQTGNVFAVDATTRDRATTLQSNTDLKSGIAELNKLAKENPDDFRSVVNSGSFEYQTASGETKTMDLSVLKNNMGGLNENKVSQMDQLLNSNRSIDNIMDEYKLNNNKLEAGDMKRAITGLSRVKIN